MSTVEIVLTSGVCMLSAEGFGLFSSVPSFFSSSTISEQPIKNTRRKIFETFKRDTERSLMTYSPEMLAAIKRARHEKVVNKTGERERERRGEVLRQTIRRRNKGPPAHVLARMTPEEKHMDKVVRSVSEVGYVGQVKRRLGFRLRDPEGWKVEMGRRGDKERLDEMAGMVERENERRRKEVEGT